MVFTDSVFKYFSLIQGRIRKEIVGSDSVAPFEYEDEPFFKAYQSIYETWKKRKSQRETAASLKISRDTLKKWEDGFVKYGTMGFCRICRLLTLIPGSKNS